MKKTILLSESTDHRLKGVYAALAALNSVAELHAVVAGGAPRDLLLGRTPRDFDIFVSVPDMHMPGMSGSEAWTEGLAANAARVTCEIVSALHRAGITEIVHKPNYHYRRDDVIAVLCTVADIEIILTPIQPDNVELQGCVWDSLLSSFDTPLCEAAAEIANEKEPGLFVWSSSDFDAFAEGKVLGFYPDSLGNGWPRLTHDSDHIAKLARAFPDFRPVLLGERRPKPITRASPILRAAGTPPTRWPDDVPF